MGGPIPRPAYLRDEVQEFAALGEPAPEISFAFMAAPPPPEAPAPPPSLWARVRSTVSRLFS